MLNELAAEIHKINREKGFWEPTRIPCACNNGHTHPIQRDPLGVLDLIHSEVSEATEAVRDDKWVPEVTWHPSAVGFVGPHIECRNGQVFVYDSDIEVTEDQLRGWGYVPKPEGVASELADILIRTLDAAAAWGIDIDKATAQKIEYNRTRPIMHGRKR